MTTKATALLSGAAKEAHIEGLTQPGMGIEGLCAPTSQNVPCGDVTIPGDMANSDEGPFAEDIGQELSPLMAEM